MTRSSLTTESHATAQQSSREGAKVDMVILHHSATTNMDTVLGMMTSASRKVSSNYVVKDKRVASVVPEEYRAWTSGSSTDGGKGAAFDRRAITFEVPNSGGAPGWPVSPESHESVAQVVADLHKRYGIPLDRDHIVGHKELWTRWNASYPTACPGGLEIDWIVARAKQIAKGSAPAKPAKPAKPSKPAPAKPASAPAFPLPAGWYFGPRSGPTRSVSGYHGHRDDLRRWQSQMARRGWTIGVDGLYGPNTEQNAREFQREKGLTVDGLIGPATWRAAWTSPVT